MKNYKILYEDKDLWVIFKPSGMAVQSARACVPDLMSKLRNECLARGENAYLGLINRLDQPVEGILLVAKNQEAAANLSAQVNEHMQMQKYYQALVCGKLSQKEGALVDYLIHDKKQNISKIGKKGEAGAKYSKLEYRVLEEWEDTSLLEIQLFTGRHHQIRAQLAHAGVPILGDTKYGTQKAQQLALCSFKTVFLHPRTKEHLCFSVEPTFPIPPRAPSPEGLQKDQREALKPQKGEVQ